MAKLAQTKVFPKGEHRATKLNELSKAAQDLPFYNLLPKDEVGLLKWRIYAHRRALEDTQFRAAIWEMGRQDIGFFSCTFSWIHETRGKTPRSFPFTPWLDQVDLLAWLTEDLGERDYLVDKSRGIGVSWLVAIIAFWKWSHVEAADIAFVSKDDTSLDMKGIPSTLMGKLDFLFDHMPAWSKYDAQGKTVLDRTVTKHKFTNLRTKTSILGFVPADDKLRSGRYLFVLFDEFAFVKSDMRALMAAVQPTTFCRLFISTYHGTNFFYRLAHDETTSMLRISTFWWDNTARVVGLYQSKAGVVQFLDPNFKYDENYDFVTDGLLRSPWFDEELNRAGADLQTALEELNGVAAISGRKLFRKLVLDASETYVRSANYRGEVTEEGVYEEDLEGRFRWWQTPGPGSLAGPFVIGVDPSQGVPGGAYGAITAIDVQSGEQVVSAALTLVPPIVLAQITVGLAKLLAGPRGDGWSRIIYETTGAVGAAFGTELVRLRFGGIWKNDKDKPGYQNQDCGEAILHELGRAMLTGELFVHDMDAVAELPGYEYNVKDENLDLEWTGTDGHGDRSMALAIAWHGAKRHRRAFLPKKEPDMGPQIGIEFEPSWTDRKTEELSCWSMGFRRQL